MNLLLPFINPGGYFVFQAKKASSTLVLKFFKTQWQIVKLHDCLLKVTDVEMKFLGTKYVLLNIFNKHRSSTYEKQIIQKT